MDYRSEPAVPAGLIALFLDVDGTLIDIASRPDAVMVPDELIETLSALDAGLQGAVALVSGRTIADLDKIFRPLRLRASGVHGAETRTDLHAATNAVIGAKLPDDVVASITAVAVDYDRTILENKGYSVAVHYRANPEIAPRLRADLAALVARSGLDLQVLPGHMVFEVKQVTFNKGSAVTRFMQAPPFAGRKPIFLGDDITDLPGFEATLAGGGLAFSVGTPRERVSGHFDDPAHVRTWLACLAKTDWS